MIWYLIYGCVEIRRILEDRNSDISVRVRIAIGIGWHGHECWRLEAGDWLLISGCWLL